MAHFIKSIFGSKGKKMAARDSTGDKVKLWVSRLVSFSTQYNSSSWSAKMIIGEPRVYPKYGDIHGAWAQGVCDSNQFIEVGFDEAIFIEQVNIYETYHGGSVRCIQARKQGNKWTTIWDTTKLSTVTTARIFSPEFQKTAFMADELRIETDCSYTRSWCELDAVQIVGTRYSINPPPDPGSFAEDLSLLVDNKMFSDVEFLVEKKKFNAHKAILTVRSDYFRAMFCDKMLESQCKKPIEFPDVRSNTFAMVLNFVYTNSIPEGCSCLQIVDLWRVADRFNMTGLQDLAICAVTEKMNVDNVVDVYVETTTTLPEITDLKTICIDFMKTNMSEVVRTKSFTLLPQELMVDLIQLMTSKMNI